MANTVSAYAKAGYPVGQYPGGRVKQAAYGTIEQGAVGSAAADTIDICKVPGNALILSATAYVNGVAVTDAEITIGTEDDATAFDAPFVQLDEREPVTVRLTSVEALDFPADGVIGAIVDYVTDQPVPR